MLRLAAVVLVLATGCADPAGAALAPVVYEEDGRTEPYLHPNAALRAVAAQSIAMKVDEDLLDASNPSDVRFDYARTLGEAKDLCDGERFADQIEPGVCSGTLVDARHVLTAGHCVDTARDCTGYAWVFGFRYVADGELATLTADDVYACSRVIAYFDDDYVDHAIVELDRPVVGHAPATVRAVPLPRGTPLALIGHPNGIPMKIDDGGVVTWNDEGFTHLQATLDAFSGNSGSGVFDHDGNLVALLRGGEDDYVDAGGCNVVNVIDPAPTDDGEALVYLEPALDAFCATPGVDSPLCACEGPCVAALEGDTCDGATVIEAVSQTITGGLEGYANAAQGSCGGAGPDRAYAFTLDAPARFTARTSGFDTVVHLRAGCDGEELACHDDVDRDTDRGSRVAETLGPGEHVLFVDAYDADVGTFTLTLTFETTTAPDAGAPVEPDAGTPVGPDAGAPPPEDSGCAVGRRTPPGFALGMVGLVAGGLRRRRA